MGSLVVKLDANTVGKLKNMHNYSDVDVLGYKQTNGYQSVYGIPIQREGGVPMAYDVDAVKISIRNILMWRVGESVLRPSFGHNLKREMYSQLDEYNKGNVCEEIKRAIEENEPRAKIYSVNAQQVEDDDGQDTNALNVTVTYGVIGRDNTNDARFVEQTTISGK